jgi:diaminopimelate epimerase
VKTYKIIFSKIQGCGNSFVICDKQNNLPKSFNWGKFSKQICDFNYGIGADTLLTVSKGKKAPFFMEVYNPDGSKAQVSGNGTRCVVRYLLEKGFSPRLTKEIETVKGLVGSEILNGDLSNLKVRVNLGRQVKEIKRMTIKLRNKTVDVIYVDIGNPHGVRLVNKFPVDWKEQGYLIEHHPVFRPHKVNVEFGRVINKQELEVRVWERGVGAVLSSGTGASGAVLAGIFAGKLSNEVKARMAGGDLEIEYDPRKKNLFITGPAQTVCQGVFYYNG